MRTVIFYHHDLYLIHIQSGFFYQKFFQIAFGKALPQTYVYMQGDGWLGFLGFG